MNLALPTLKRANVTHWFHVKVELYLGLIDMEFCSLRDILNGFVIALGKHGTLSNCVMLIALSAALWVCSFVFHCVMGCRELKLVVLVFVAKYYCINHFCFSLKPLWRLDYLYKLRTFDSLT